jgi:hypothetical protein
MVQIYRGKLDHFYLPFHPLSISSRYKHLFACQQKESKCGRVQLSLCVRSKLSMPQGDLPRSLLALAQYPQQAQPRAWCLSITEGCCNRVQLHTLCLKSPILSFETAYQIFASFRLGGHWEKGIPECRMLYARYSGGSD